MNRVHFNIGSNLGDRLANIGMAVALLEKAIGIPAALSTPFVSPAWGYDSDNEFINVGVNFSTVLSPAALLNIARRIELEIDPQGSHRTASGAYADRIIDIDLICYGSTVSHNDPLLPHPRLHLREFVLVPLMELMPDWVHPHTGRSAKEMLEALHTKNG